MVLKSSFILKIFFLAFLVILLYFALSINYQIFAIPQAKLTDFYTQLTAQIKPPPKVLEDIVIVAIDGDSIRLLNRRWPWERSIFAYLIKCLDEYSPRFIFFDFVFSGKSTTNNDKFLKEVLASTKNVFLASYINEQGQYIEPYTLFRENIKGYGLINKPRDKDFFIRRGRALVFSKENNILDYSIGIRMLCAINNIPYDNIVYNSVSNILTIPSSKTTYNIPLYKDKTFDLDYPFFSKKIKIIPAWKIFKKDINKEVLKGKIVLTGTTAEIAHDIYNTPMGVLPGIVINSYELITLLNNHFFRTLPNAFSFFIIFFIVSIIIISSFWLPLKKNLIVFIVIIFLSLVFFVLLHINKIKVDSFGPILLGTIFYLVINFHKQIDLLLESVKLRELALTDSLTGAYVRRYFYIRLQYEWERSLRYQQNFSLFMLDIDNFKHLNDTYGHLAGDYVLQELSKIMHSSCRKVDLICRYGGEEFCLVLPQINKEHTLLYAEKLRKLIADHEFKFKGQLLRISVSIGVAAFKEVENFTPEDLIGLADKRLYQAKTKGRNCVVIDGEGTAT